MGVHTPNAANTTVPGAQTAGQTPGFLALPTVPAATTASSVPTAIPELPALPQPPFLVQRNPGSGLVTPSPAGQTPAGMQTAIPAVTAQSTPLDATMPSLPEIPPPHMVAPWVFTQAPQTQMPTQHPPAPMPPQPPQQNQPPAQPEQKPPETPPQEQTPPEPPKPTSGTGLDETTVRLLNDRLNSSAESIRADAAMELFKILEANPSLSEDPAYKPYVDAFIEKIMNDPSALVRQGGELALELGLVKSPTPGVMSALQKISQKNSVYDIEPGIAAGILAKLQGGGQGHDAPAATAGHGAPAGDTHAAPALTTGGAPETGNAHAAPVAAPAAHFAGKLNVTSPADDINAFLDAKHAAGNGSRLDIQDIEQGVS